MYNIDHGWTIIVSMGRETKNNTEGRTKMSRLFFDDMTFFFIESKHCFDKLARICVIIKPCKKEVDLKNVIY